MRVTPYDLTYGQDVVLPMEVQVRSLRVSMQNGLTQDDFSKTTIIKLEDLDEQRLTTLDKLLAQKAIVAKVYNKKVKLKNFQISEMVWKLSCGLV